MYTIARLVKSHSRHGLDIVVLALVESVLILVQLVVAVFLIHLDAVVSRRVASDSSKLRCATVDRSSRHHHHSCAASTAVVVWHWTNA